jgi:hypothetical protein
VFVNVVTGEHGSGCKISMGDGFQYRRSGGAMKSALCRNLTVSAMVPVGTTLLMWAVGGCVVFFSFSNLTYHKPVLASL